MVDCVGENPERPWQKALVEAERHVTRERITQALKTADIDPPTSTRAVSDLRAPSLVPWIIEEWPEAFLDKRLFKPPYAGVKEPGAKRQMVATITGYLDDIAWLTSAPHEAPRDQMIRARLSLDLLPDELAGHLVAPRTDDGQDVSRRADRLAEGRARAFMRLAIERLLLHLNFDDVPATSTGRATKAVTSSASGAASGGCFNASGRKGARSATSGCVKVDAAKTFYVCDRAVVATNARPGRSTNQTQESPAVGRSQNRPLGERR